MCKVLVVSSYYFVTLRACMNRYAIKHTERKQLELWNKFHNFRKTPRISNFFYFKPYIYLLPICVVQSHVWIQAYQNENQILVDIYQGHHLSYYQNCQ